MTERESGRQVAPIITGPLNTPVQLGFKPGKESRDAGAVDPNLVVE